MAWNLKSEEEVKEYLKNLEIEYTFGCYSEKNPEVCHSLGDFYEAIKKDFPKSGKIYKNNCDDYNYARSCFSYGTYSFVGRGLPSPDYEEARKYFLKACDANIADACFNAGLMHTMENKLLPKNYKNYNVGLPLLEKSCQLGSEHGCYFLSGFYLTGSKDRTIGKDMAKAFDYSQKACDLKNIYACSNLSLMYKKGEGVEKNLEMSDKFKKRALQLQEEYRDNMTLNFGRDPNGV